MIRVNAIPNYNNQISFNGVFNETPELAKTIQSASEAELKKFTTILKNMPAVNDGLEWSLTSKNVGSKVLVFLSKVRKCADGATFRGNTTLSNAVPEEAYKDVMPRLNKILERYYPAK